MLFWCAPGVFLVLFWYFPAALLVLSLMLYGTSSRIAVGGAYQGVPPRWENGGPHVQEEVPQRQ